MYKRQVQRVVGHNVSVNLGKADAILAENEQVKGETFKPTERIKVYILEVKDTPKGPRILVSRTHPGLVKRLSTQQDNARFPLNANKIHEARRWKE